MTRRSRLSPGGEARLARFAAEFERLDAAAYATLASRVDGDRELRAEVRAAVEEFRDWAARAYSSRLVQTDTVFLFQSLADRADDRVRFAAALERAVIAVALWDQLEPDDRLVLLGPFEAMAERAATP